MLVVFNADVDSYMAKVMLDRDMTRVLVDSLVVEVAINIGKVVDIKNVD